MKKFMHQHDFHLTIISVVCLIFALVSGIATHIIWNGPYDDIPYEAGDFMWVSFHVFRAITLICASIFSLWVIAVITYGKDIAHNK